MFDVIVPEEMLEKAESFAKSIEGVTQEGNVFKCETEEVCEAFSRAVFL